MKAIKLIILIVIIFPLTNCTKRNTNNTSENTIKVESQQYYQLKIYSFDTEEQMKSTDKYLKEAYLPGLKKLNINHIGVFKQRLNENDSAKKTFVLIPFSSMQQFLDLEVKLNKDTDYLAAGSNYINASHIQPPYKRIESTLMKAFPDMPHIQATTLNGPRPERVYELRSYESGTERYHMNKVDMFNNGGEIKLFDKLEFNAVFYAKVISGSKMPNLMYMTTFSDMTSRNDHWKAFGDSQEWNEMKSMSKYENNMSHIDILFLFPTEYSDY